MSVTSEPAGSASRPRILCVDDEPLVLEGFRDTLRRVFTVVTATSAAEGLEHLRADPGGFSIVLSDMRMPGVSGAAFLGEAMRIAPTAVRLLLTGHADVDVILKAVNEGQVFRFLTKPCGHDELLRACAASLAQRRLITAERVLLEQTLRGSVQALADVLSLTSPAAFGRGTRVREMAIRLATAAEVDDRWELEIAAMLVNLGAVTLPPETAEKLYAGERLTPHEEEMVERLPQATRRILEQIPRLEGVLEVLAGVELPFEGVRGRVPVPAACVLRLALDHDGLVGQGVTHDVALATLSHRSGTYDPALVALLEELLQVSDQTVRMRSVGLDDLRVGMRFADDVRAAQGPLLVPRGSIVSTELAERLRNYRRDFVEEPLRVFEEMAHAG